MLVERNESRTTIQARIGGDRETAGAIPVLGTFEVPQTWSEKHQQRQFGGPNRARSNLQNSSPRSYCSLIGCLGRPVAPQPGRGVLSLGVVPTLATGTKCDIDVTLIIFASFRPGSDTRRSGGR